MKTFLLTTIGFIAMAISCNAQWTTAGANAYFTLTGNIGVGTTTPAYKLDITKLSAGSALNLTGQALGTRNDAGIDFSAHNAVTVNYARIGLQISSGLSGFETGGLTFSTINGGALAERLFISGAGNVGIGTLNPDQKLSVNGTIHSKEVKVDLTGWPDYVFKPNYQLPSLTEVKAYIDQNHHLPEIPSEQEIAKDGLNLGEMNRLLVKKVEELTLYLVEKDKQQQEQNCINLELKAEIQ